MSDGDLMHLPTAPDVPHPLGRSIVHHDPRNRAFPIRSLLERRDKAQTRPWWTVDVFDQQGPSCTAQAATGVLATSPFRLHLDRKQLRAFDTEAERHALYRRAQRVDPWPGENYDGSSTDAPFRVLRSEGYIREWRWCFGLADVLDTLRWWGPVAVGTTWTEDMFYPEGPHALIRPSGPDAGGHAYRLVEADDERQEVVIVNSWGRSYGRNGRVRMAYDDLDALLQDQGEACTVVL